jgi:NADPH:quinone reductase-like Zn-dependent oxidoreductase
VKRLFKTLQALFTYGNFQYPNAGGLYMKAMVITSFGSSEVLEQRDAPKPEPGPHDLLVKIVATAANPCDYQTRRGDYKDDVECPAIIGIDASGVVEAIGTDVAKFKPGDEVFYMMELFTRPGAFAEYNLVDESIVALKPKNINHFEAASLPLVFSTAYGCLIERARLKVGESVLIHAAAGGVGSIAVQLARASGAYVFACSTGSIEFVKSLGADRVIDYKTESYESVINDETNGKGVDVVLDTIGENTLERSPYLMKNHGRIVSIVDIAAKQSLLEAWGRNITMHFFFVEPTAHKMEVLRDLVERGEIRPVVNCIMPLTQVGEAQLRQEQGGVQGKIVFDTSK